MIVKVIYIVELSCLTKSIRFNVAKKSYKYFLALVYNTAEFEKAIRKYSYCDRGVIHNFIIKYKKNERRKNKYQNSQSSASNN